MDRMNWINDESICYRCKNYKDCEEKIPDAYDCLAFEEVDDD